MMLSYVRDISFYIRTNIGGGSEIYIFYCPHPNSFVDTHDLPQFSSSTLAGKYALSEHLDYVYYLRRGQPSFAFANFVASKLLGHSNTAKRYICMCVYKNVCMHVCTYV